jgi:transposase
MNQWSGLESYLKDGRVELDNNLCENTIRPLKIGAKNYLFMGSRRGGELACVAYTLIENCKRHGLDLHDYLTSAMKAVVEQGPARAPELTPAVIAKVRRLKKTS